MALRDQPYFPLYVQDFLTDEKLNMCSASTQGVYIKLLCIFHKSENYGGFLFKQKHKQKESMSLNFAYAFAKLLPFDSETIQKAIDELLEENVLTFENDFLYQKRMVKDFQTSLKRSEAGKSGGGNPNLFKQKDKQTSKQKDKQNTEYVNENKDENINKNGSDFSNFTHPTYLQVEEQFFRLYRGKYSDEKIKKSAKTFHDHYTGLDWMYGKSRIINFIPWVSKWSMEEKKNGTPTKLLANDPSKYYKDE